MKHIRNFSIIAHVDHGKSTLADRLIQQVGLVSARDFHDQMLDTMDIERERGITIKSQTVVLPYQAADGNQYELNLIDTPGHVDFSYEVSRALASCEGVLLVVDASQGVEAQTVANLYKAMEYNLSIIPVINKIDLPSADVDKVKEQIERELALDAEGALLCSAKEGTGIAPIFEAIVNRIPPPTGDENKPFTALIFDAHYDTFRGTVVSCRVFDGRVAPGDSIRLMAQGTTHLVEEVGFFRIQREPKPELTAGEVGYLLAGIKTVSDTRIGDTITSNTNPAPRALAGFKEVKPVVFSSIYPVSSEDYESLADALDKYLLNDASLVFQKDSSAALGQGFRCGFLGLLHLEIVQERLRREFNQSLIMTIPSVKYIFHLSDDTRVTVDNPAHYPDPSRIRGSEEPYVKLIVYTPDRYMGAVMTVCGERRGLNPRYNYLRPTQLEIFFDIPLAEVIFDFHDKLKSITQGYGSFDYEFLDYRPSELSRLDILVNSERVDALSAIVHKERAYQRASQICEKLKQEIPQHQFQIIIQGAVGGRIIARTTVKAFRKDVIAKCYGGDVTRKRKLLEKQKEGKKKMKMVGQVMIPQKAFIEALKIEHE